MSSSQVRVRIITNEFKTISSSLQAFLISPPDNGTLISLLNRLSVLQAQLTFERKWRTEPDLTLAVQYAQLLINYINDPLVIDPYYSILKLKLSTNSFDSPKILYMTAIIQLLNKPTIANIRD